MNAALRDRRAWLFGCVLAAAALAFHFTAHYWHQAGLRVMHGDITARYAAVLVAVSLACGIALWHWIGSHHYPESMPRRLGRCVALGVAATILIHSLLAVLLVLGAGIQAGRESGHGIPAILGASALVLFLGAWSVFVPAVPYGVAAGAAFYLIVEGLQPATTDEARWPAWLMCASVLAGFPLGFGVLFGPKAYAHSTEGVVPVLLALLGTAVLAAWAVFGIVMLIRRPQHRTAPGYLAVLLAAMVSALVFVPTGLLR